MGTAQHRQRTSAPLGALLLVLLVAATASAQYTPPDTPPDSPLWWPLFDGITADELRAEHQEDAIKRLYAAAGESGRAPDCNPGYVPHRFRDSGASPELVPLWYALEFTVRWPWLLAEQSGQPEAERENVLREAGLSERGTATLGHFVREVTREMDRRQELLDEATKPMHDAISKFEGENPPLPHEHLSAAIAARATGSLGAEDNQHLERFRLVDDIFTGRGDALALSRIMDGSYSDWSTWLEAAKAKPQEEALELYLPRLRRELSSEDWLTLRRYLSTNVGDRRTADYSVLDCPNFQSFDSFNPPVRGTLQ